MTRYGAPMGTPGPSANAVRRYLREQFRGHPIVDFEDHGSRVRIFRVDDPRGTPIALATVSIEFLEHLTPDEMLEHLFRYDLAAQMRVTGPGFYVIVATNGLRTEPVSQ